MSYKEKVVEHNFLRMNISSKTGCHLGHGFYVGIEEVIKGAFLMSLHYFVSTPLMFGMAFLQRLFPQSEGLSFQPPKSRMTNSISLISCSTFTNTLSLNFLTLLASSPSHSTLSIYFLTTFSIYFLLLLYYSTFCLYFLTYLLKSILFLSGVTKPRNRTTIFFSMCAYHQRKKWNHD